MVTTVLENPNNYSTSRTNNAMININQRDSARPYFLNPNDEPNTFLTNHLLTADKYHSWVRIVQRSLRIKRKFVFIDGSLYKPIDLTDPLIDSWIECNDMVVTWL